MASHAASDRPHHLHLFSSLSRAGRSAESRLHGTASGTDESSRASLARGGFALVRHQGISVPEGVRCERRPGSVIGDASLEGHAPKDGQGGGHRGVRAARKGRRCHGCFGRSGRLWRSQGIVGALWQLLSQLRDRLRCARTEAGQRLPHPLQTAYLDRDPSRPPGAYDKGSAKTVQRSNA